MDISKLKTLYQILKKSSVEELVVKSPDFSLKICKGDDHDEVVDVLDDAPASSENPAADADKIVAQQPVKGVKGAKTSLAGDDENVFDVLSSQVGFFSRFNSKTGKQYVKLRDVVKKGDVIGVVMAMHIEHQIVAGDDGKIRDFLVEERQPVEYAQPLVRLLPLEKEEQTQQKSEPKEE